MKSRNILQQLFDALADTPVVLVNGPRQAGKSTLVQSPMLIKEGRHYMTFDNPSVLAAAKSDPEGFIAGLPEKVTLDEIQHIPELFPVIKASVDCNRKPGRFLLTGSANVLLLPKLSESLAGRIEILTLWPFSQGELKQTQEGFIDFLFSTKSHNSAQNISKKTNRTQLLEKVLMGSYPPAIARKTPMRRKAWFKSYLTTILQRDVRDFSNITDLTVLPRLLATLASRTGGLLNFADLSRTLMLPQTTLKRYFTLLETTFLIQLLRPWSTNLGQRSIHTPKVYLNDTGLLAHLLGLTIDRFTLDPTLTGSIMENFILMELLKQGTWSQTQPEFFFWRTASGQEVDILLEDSAGHLVGIEIKASASVGKKEISGLQTLATLAGKRWLRGVVLYTGSEIIPFAKNLHAIPMTQIWSEEYSQLSQ